MENFYKSMGFIIGFLITTFLIETFAGEKVASNINMFILFSMLILNSDKFSNLLKNLSE